MPGTRAQALAPITLQHPDEADPAIAMVALEAAHDPQGPADEPSDEPQHGQDQGAGVIGRATRSLTGFLAGRNGTPGTRTPRAVGSASGETAAAAGRMTYIELEAAHERLQAERESMLARLVKEDGRSGKGSGSSARRASTASSTASASRTSRRRSSISDDDNASRAGDGDDDLIYSHLAGVKSLDSEEARNLKISLERETIVAKMPDVLDELAGRHPLIEEVLALDEAALRTRLDPEHADYDPGLHAADRYVKRQLTKVLDRSTPEGQVFFEDEADLRKDDRAAHQSGVLLAERVLAFGAIEDRADAEAHLEMIKATAWLKQGETEISLKLGVAKLRAAWYELPRKQRDANDLTDLLLKAIPSTVAWDTERNYAQRLAHEMDEHEALGMGRKWTFAQLKRIIIKRLRRSPIQRVQATMSPTVLTAHNPRTPTPTDTGGTAGLRPADGTMIKATMGKWVGDNRTYCFLKVGDGKDDLFCHKSSIVGTEPEEGEEVELMIKHVLKFGKLKERADQVKRVGSIVAVAATEGDDGGLALSY